MKLVKITSSIDRKEDITIGFIHEREKCGSEAFLGSYIVTGPKVARDWQIATDLRKQLIIPQEIVSTSLRVVVVIGPVNCLLSKADSAM